MGQAPNDQQSNTAADGGSRYAPGLLKAFVDEIKHELGNDATPEMLRQCVADLNTQQRQDARNHYEARQEYIRQVAEIRTVSLNGIREYGMQTLKWLFLLNAGAIAVILAYVSGAIGKPASGMSGTALVPVLKALWPFVVGCTFVVASGAASFFNFSYGEAYLPSSEGLHQFINPKSSKWPESRMNFSTRKITGSRTVAIIFAFGSMLFFGYGVYRVLHAALKQLS